MWLRVRVVFPCMLSNPRRLLRRCSTASASGGARTALRLRSFAAVLVLASRALLIAATTTLAPSVSSIFGLVLLLVWVWEALDAAAFLVPPFLEGLLRLNVLEIMLGCRGFTELVLFSLLLH